VDTRRDGVKRWMALRQTFLLERGHVHAILRLEKPVMCLKIIPVIFSREAAGVGHPRGTHRDCAPSREDDARKEIIVYSIRAWV